MSCNLVYRFVCFRLSEISLTYSLNQFIVGWVEFSHKVRFDIGKNHCFIYFVRQWRSIHLLPVKILALCKNCRNTQPKPNICIRIVFAESKLRVLCVLLIFLAVFHLLCNAPIQLKTAEIRTHTHTRISTQNFFLLPFTHRHHINGMSWKEKWKEITKKTIKNADDG